LTAVTYNEQFEEGKSVLMSKKPIKPVLTLKKAIPVILTTSILLASPRKTEEGRVYDSNPYFGSCSLVLKMLEFCSYKLKRYGVWRCT
jgi:hypothetical protein